MATAISRPVSSSRTIAVNEAVRVIVGSSTNTAVEIS